jgi:hypothetical protein
MNWLKKVMSWLTGSNTSVPPAPKKDPYPPSVQIMIDEMAPFIKDPKPVKGRKKRSGTPPRR